MNTDKPLPQTLIDVARYFADIDRCNEYMASIRWPGGRIKCPKCSGERVGKITTRKMLRCKDCRKQFSYKVGTIFEDSPLGLDKWFVAVWCIANSKNGISSYEVARALGIQQRSAWHMMHRVRLAMRTQSFTKIKGEIESDETFIGGAARNMHPGKRKVKGRGTVGKVVVHGLLERGGEVRVDVVPNQKRATLQPRIRANVQQGETVYTDSLASYVGLDADYVHQMIDHAKCYVEGRCHTNSLENFWSLLKRTLGGTYVQVEPFHLFRYLDEQSWRFNKRKATDAERFGMLMAKTVGKRLTFNELTGNADGEDVPSPHAKPEFS